MDAFLILTFLVSVLLLLHALTQPKKGVSLPPGPLGFPLIGNLPQLGTSPHLTLTKMSEKYGPCFMIKMGCWPAIVISSIDVAKEAFLKQRSDFAARPNFDSFKLIHEGRSIAFGRFDESWSKRKKLTNTALRLVMHSLSEQQLEKAMIRECDHMILDLLKADGQPIDPKPSLELSVGGVIYGTLFGLKKPLREDIGFRKFLGAQDAFSDFQATGGNISDLLPWTKFFLRQRVRTFINIIEQLQELVKEKYQEHRFRSEAEMENCVMDHLISAVRGMSHDELEAFDLTENMLVRGCEELMGAGMQTIICVLRWAFLHLALHQGMQEKIRQEIYDVIGKTTTPSGKHRSNMPFTSAFILESIRLTAPTPFLLPHAAAKDTTLCGFDIKKDTLVMVNCWALSRDPNVWNDPNTFRPERFLNEDDVTVNTKLLDDFMPFGLGKRRCSGERVAKLEVFLFITNLLQKCELKLSDGETPTLEGKFGLALEALPYRLVVNKVA